VAEAVATLEGWWMLHDLRHVLPGLGDAERRERQGALEEYVRAVMPSDPEHGASAYYEVMGQKGDFLQVHLRPGPDDLLTVEEAFRRSHLDEVLVPAMSYLSVVEISTYGAGDRPLPEDPLADPYLRGRLHPEIPPARWVSFYPMDKRRLAGEGNNWYELPMAERRRLMHDHGLIGRRYAGRVKQVISGSVGLDDYEWGVTLFAANPLDFKKIVYEMRFDEVSARFAEFGPFILGRRLEIPGERSLFL